MKKKIVLLCFGVLLLFGCEKRIKTDLSKQKFVGVSWIRDNGHDLETIRFNEDGSFSYSCACGNSVNDADLCDSYSYDENNKEIRLECFETTESTITEIKIISLTDTSIELDFDGEIRKFEKNNGEVIYE